MTRHKRLVGVCVVGVFLIVAAACGQKPGVSDSAAAVPAGALGALPSGATVNSQGQIVDASGNVIGTSAGGGGLTGGSLSGGTGGGGTTTTTTGGTTTGGGGTTATGGGGTTSGGGGGTTSGDTTGITANTITIGIHAPITGAAPVPSSSLDKGKDLYFRWLESQGKTMFGRKIQVVLKNDNYNPSQAVSVCKEMVEQDHVFLLIGAAGTDQIQACARYAASVGVPYLSNGVTEVGLNGLPNYFALSMTYPQQQPLLAQEITNDLGGKSKVNGIIWFQTPNFQDAHDAFMSSMKQQGSKVAFDKPVSKEANDTDAAEVIQEMKAAGVQNAFVLTSPTFLIQLLKAADQNQYHPQWVGVGLTMTFDVVANVSCPNIDGARFFSPFPAWSDRNKFDPDFEKAWQKFYGGTSDDFEWSEWSLDKLIWDAFQMAGPNMSRQSFINTLAHAHNLSNGIGPTLNYTPQDRFGANSVHLDQAQCSGSNGAWHTIRSFVTHF